MVLEHQTAPGLPVVLLEHRGGVAIAEHRALELSLGSAVAVGLHCDGKVIPVLHFVKYEGIDAPYHWNMLRP
jgi:hypothetical protein